MTESFYDSLADYYRLIYPDWEASLKHQAGVLDAVIKEYFGDQVESILDAACGIGTQCIGLAELGYRLVGTDISAAEIELAQQEALTRGLQIEFKQADMRFLVSEFDRTFDLVIACDNAIPHLLSDGDILQAFKTFHALTHEGGGCLISVRDYAVMDCSGRRINPRRVHQSQAERTILFDVWEFEGNQYEVTIYIVRDEAGSSVKAQAVRGGRYYCVTIDRLERLFDQAGFSRVFTLNERFFQPLILAQK